MKTQEEILAAIYPVIRMHIAMGDRIRVSIEDQCIKVSDAAGNLGGSFTRDLAAVCTENAICFSIRAKNNKPYILL